MEAKQQEKKKIFICYHDDDDVKRSTYVNLISKDQNFITFETKANLVTLPINRILKMKEELSEACKNEQL